MSMSGKALRFVQKSLPRLRLCKNQLILSPTEHIVRGYMIERTSYKGAFYLHRIVAPLYRMSMKYSTRIANGDYIYLSRERATESGELVLNLISRDLPRVEAVKTPGDFLDHISWMIGNDTPGFLFDLAVTYFLVGRYPE